MASHRDVKRIKASVGGRIPHSILADLGTAMTLELRERANLQLPPPTGKRAIGGKVTVNFIFDGPLAEQDRDRVRAVMQRVQNPTELIRVIKHHTGE